MDNLTKRKTAGLKVPRLYRSALFDRAQVDDEARTAAIAFSSEEPVERFFGIEILDHGKGAVRLDRLANGGPLLVGHNDGDQIGTVEQAEVGADRRGRAVVRFSRSARAEEIWNDVKDGIRRHISVGYRVHQMRADDQAKNTFRVVDWEPMEVSIVAIPADATVGVGRADDEVFDVQVIQESTEMSDTKPIEAAQDAAPAQPEQRKRADVEVVTNDVRAREQSRMRALQSLGKQYASLGGEQLAQECIASGRDVADLQSMLLDRMNARVIPQHGEIGMTEEEKKEFSITRLINAIANPRDNSAQRAAAFEFDCSNAALQTERRALRGGAQATIPYDVLAYGYGKRDLLAGTGTLGGNTVGTDLQGGNFIDLYKARTYVVQAGATVLSGLNGFVAIPSLATSATAYWVAEGTAPTEGAMNFGQVTLSPKTVGAWVDFSRKLMLQSSIDVEAFVRRELASQLAVETDRVAINGAGTGAEPAGILASTSVGTTTAGANGLAPTWQNMVDLESLVANQNADIGSLAYFTNTKVRGKLKTVLKSTSAVAGFIWDNTDMPINGYRAFVTNNVPWNLTKGTSTAVCSAALFGNWQDVLVGQWGGGVDLLVDPYTASNTGTVRVVALADMDIAIRRVGSFAYIKDLLTS